MFGKYLEVLKLFNDEAQIKVPKNMVTEKKKISGTKLHHSPTKVPPNLEKKYHEVIY